MPIKVGDVMWLRGWLPGNGWRRVFLVKIAQTRVHRYSFRIIPVTNQGPNAPKNWWVPDAQLESLHPLEQLARACD